MSVYDVIDQIEAAKQRRFVIDAPPMDPPADRAAVLRHARAYLAAIPPAIEGQRGDEHTFRVCCKLALGFTLDDGEALALLAPWNATCAPPWTEGELLAKLTSARRNGREPVGGKLGDRPGWTGDPVVEDGPPPGDAEAVSAPIAERFPVFCARLRDRQTPPDIIPGGLIPGMGITMPHGQPRALKTWTALECARAVVCGDAAFGLERFRVLEPLQAWYNTEEDPELSIRNCFTALFAGRNGGQHPEGLHLSVQRGVSLDDPAYQEACITYAREHEIKVTFWDPIRASSECVDQGPREIRPLALFLRRFMRETGSVVVLVHHDTKPLAGSPDTRAKPQRASGGGIFSIADAPIHAELIGPGSRTLLTPSHYKFSTAPDPFIVTLEADDPKTPTWVRLHGEETTAAEATAITLHQKMADYLREHPGTSGSRVAQGIHGRKDQVLAALDDLHAKGLATYSQRGQARLWSWLAAEDAQ